MRKLIAILLLFAIAAVTSVGSGSNGGTTIKTDNGGLVLSVQPDASIVVADEATVYTYTCLQEASTFEGKEGASFTESTGVPFSMAFCPLFGPNDLVDDNQYLRDSEHITNRITTDSGYNSIEGARLKIVYPFLC